MRLTVSVPPHRHCGVTVQSRMAAMLTAMLPAAAMAVLVFGSDAFRVMGLSVSVAVMAEAVCDYFMEQRTRVYDLHAVFTGLCFAFLLPASAPWWLVTLGSAATIVFGKMVFGGLGGSPFCAPLVGWAICRISWPMYMDVDATMLTMELNYPLAQLKNYGLHAVDYVTMGQLFMGKQLGGLGAVQVAAVLLGGLLLVLRKHIGSVIPVGVLAGVYCTAQLFHMGDPQVYAPGWFHLFTGSVVFAAFFLATDGPSSPNRPIPMLLFGLFIGVMVVLIRIYGTYPDGVPFAILLANLLTPALDRIAPKPFGAGGAA
jgi:electron transport complex protein RnfD